MAHDFSSFNYRVTHPKITNVLNQRSLLDNTIQMAMPFVKATTTLQLDEILGNGNQGFTIGLHATELDVEYQDIYVERNASDAYPLIGYTYTEEGKNKLVYAKDPETVRKTKFLQFSKLLDAGQELATSEPGNFLRVPPPGITKVTVGKNKNGTLATADLTISVPSLIQLEMLHRTFLVPGMGMILEWGQQFTKATQAEIDLNIAEQGLDPDLNPKAFTENMFPWYNPSKRKEIFERISKKQIGLQEILNCYVYPTDGQYQWMFGHVALFNTKANSDGSFECTVKIHGESEASWAFSTTNTILPAGAPNRTVCPDGANSVDTFFTSTAAKGLNLKTLLDGVKDGKLLPAWKKHVRWIRHGNQKAGEPDKDTKTPVVNEQKFGESEDAYFMTWRFFVNVVLNHPVHGVKAIFERAGLSEAVIERISLLRPYGDPTKLDSPGEKYIDDPNEPFVGYNPYLRSTNPAVLMIVNEQAASLAEQEPGKNRAEQEARKLLNNTAQTRAFSEVGLFDKSTSAYSPDASADPMKNDRGFLSAGVWVNHKTVAAAMSSAPTVLRGITNLLDQMSAATQHYWSLTLDASEPNAGMDTCKSPDQKEKHDYIVIDMNYKENSNMAIEKLNKKIHVFNKHVRVKDGKLVGSDVIECSVDLSLPKLLFSQIATGGMAQPHNLEAANTPDGHAEPEKQCASPSILSTQEALREMFAITSVAATPDGSSPDLTAPKKMSDEEKKKIESRQCTQRNVQTTAGTAGQGNQSGKQSAQSAAPSENTREFPGLNDVLRYVDVFPNVMLGNIRCTADGDISNAVGSSPSTLSIKADITLPGINGLRVGELFWIDRIPSFYKVFGAFQIMSIEDSIDLGGWQTKIHAQFAYLGKAWAKLMINSLK